MKRQSIKTLGYFIVDSDHRPLVVTDDFELFYQGGVATYFTTRASARSTLDACKVNLEKRPALDEQIKRRFRNSSIYRISASMTQIATLSEHISERMGTLPEENNND